MFGFKKIVFASLLVVVSICGGIFCDLAVAPIAPYAVAPFARSFSAHSIHHSLAAPVAAPLTHPLPLPYAAPYFATL